MRELRDMNKWLNTVDGSEPGWIRLTCTGNSGSTQENTEVDRSSAYKLTMELTVVAVMRSRSRNGEETTTESRWLDLMDTGFLRPP